MKRLLTAIFALTTLASGSAGADEGMWTFNEFPTERVTSAYGFEPTPAWLDRVRLASARLAGGCSASFVSPDGLVMTNHHCAHSCIEQLSTAKRDYIADGFYAKEAKDEQRCPEVEVNQLVSIESVTDRIAKATEGKQGQAFNDALKAEMTRIEKACATGDDVRCDVVTLYHGGAYDLYKYRRFQDVRLVFAPETASAFFGGDPDNFNYPRYALDVSFLRIYHDGKPAKTPDYFAWSAAGAEEGELTFVTGHPGRTSRLYTVAELEYQRDVVLPQRLWRLSELRGMLTEFQNRGPEQARIATELLFGVENGLKAFKGRHEALLDKTLLAKRGRDEMALRRAVAADPRLLAEYGTAWDSIAKAVMDLRALEKKLWFAEWGAGFHADLFTHARRLVRAADELAKPNEERLREYTDGQLPAVRMAVQSAAPVHEELDVATLAFSLTKLREVLGADDPFVRQVLGKESPAALAKRVVRGSKLGNPAVRKALFDGGAAAVAASKDPMIELARLVDPEARAVRKKYEDTVEATLKKNQERVAKAHFAVRGKDTYPDATFTLRLSYGQVKGYEEHGRQVAPFTTFGGAFDRHTGSDPFALPKRWLDAKGALDRDARLNFVTTHDITGGNSGSPVINKEAQIVGLIFDGNIQSLGGDYAYDPAVNRAVSVHSGGILEALEKIYRADRLLRELRPATAAR